MIWSDFILQQLSSPGQAFDYPFAWGICFPKIIGAHDYHWAIYNGIYWLEQAGHGGNLNDDRCLQP